LGDEIARQRGQSIENPFRPAVFDRDGLALGVACFAQGLLKRGDIRRLRPGRGAAQKADHRHSLLLRAPDERRTSSAG
jgi:hypothetical protein